WGGLDLLSEQLPPDHPSRRSLEAARAAAARGSSLTRQLLTFARQMPASSERFDINARLAALDGVVGMAVGRSVRGSILMGTGALPVRADAGQFDQVILNLAINARDAMPSGGNLVIQSRLSEVDDLGEAELAIEPPYARVGVTDTGVGIPPDIVHRIF